jgi:uncharacterized metal-binding protein YceD (DUF177 family)
MQIDITKLLNGYVDNIQTNEFVYITENLLESSLIDELKNVILNGDITLDEEDNLYLTGNLTGVMILKDDITLEPVEYKFETDLEETIEKNKNILDITDILWQNIIVEIPSKVRSTSEDINLEGDGWRVISEEEFLKERNKSNNPFTNLDELLNTKEDK